MPALGSDELVTDGSTSPGPGFSRKVIGVPTENHSRAPASCGTVIVTGAPPEAFSGIAQSAPSGLPTAGGDAGKYGGRPSAMSSMRALPLLIAWPVTNAYTVSAPVVFAMLNETVAGVCAADSRVVSLAGAPPTERRSSGTAKPSSGAATTAADPASIL